MIVTYYTPNERNAHCNIVENSGQINNRTALVVPTGLL